MSVIAKMMVRARSEFGTGRLIELSCLCDNDLMVAYAGGSEEDKLFTKYSPSGDMRLHQPSGFTLSGPDEDPDPVFDKVSVAYYVMALAEDEHEYVEVDPARYWRDVNFPGSHAWTFAQCHSLTWFGADTARVEFRAGKGRNHGVDALNWKMSVDNPGASNQFKPGNGYWIVLYPAEKFDRNATIRAAHGHPALETAEADAG
jgi:hypothetical protein